VLALYAKERCPHQVVLVPLREKKGKDIREKYQRRNNSNRRTMSLADRKRCVWGQVFDNIPWPVHRSGVDDILTTIV
jgi:hypothetical protein